jgi:hypothetical protein
MNDTDNKVGGPFGIPEAAREIVTFIKELREGGIKVTVLPGWDILVRLNKNETTNSSTVGSDSVRS